MMTALRTSLAISGALASASARLVIGSTGQSLNSPGLLLRHADDEIAGVLVGSPDLRLRKLDVADHIQPVDVIGAATAAERNRHLPS
jgi:hypothetical protein